MATTLRSLLVLTILTALTSSAAFAGDFNWGKVVREVEKHIQPRPQPRPQPHPQPRPKPHPRPVPCPTPVYPPIEVEPPRYVQPDPCPVPTVRPSEPILEPFTSYAIVEPGQGIRDICEREYGDGSQWPKVVEFNQLDTRKALYAGQRLDLPVIHPDGRLERSSAPAPSTPVVTATETAPAAPPAPAAEPVAAVRVAEEREPQLRVTPVSQTRGPRVSVGSLLQLDGNDLGSEQGVVRIKLGAVALPAKVLAWSDSKMKIELPQVDLDREIDATIEVYRADGSLASDVAVLLAPEVPRLALGG